MENRVPFKPVLGVTRRLQKYPKHVLCGNKNKKSFLRIILLNKGYLQQQIHFNGKIFCKIGVIVMRVILLVHGLWSTANIWAQLFKTSLP